MEADAIIDEVASRHPEMRCTKRREASVNIRSVEFSRILGSIA
jgi:hypothetical protein